MKNFRSFELILIMPNILYTAYMPHKREVSNLCYTPKDVDHGYSIELLENELIN